MGEGLQVPHNVHQLPRAVGVGEHALLTHAPQLSEGLAQTTQGEGVHLR